MLPLVSDDDNGPVFDGAIPAEVVDGLIAVLSRWRSDWGDRPVAVVPMPSRTRPRLVASMAEHIAAAVRLDVADVLEQTGPRPLNAMSSGARVTALLNGLRVRHDATVPSGPLLLVDDYAATGWTVTLAASILRRAGSGAVLPLMLHKRP